MRQPQDKLPIETQDFPTTGIIVSSQRLTIAKLAGLSGESVFTQLAAWAAVRSTNDPDGWSPEQWPAEVRREIDEFAEALRSHGLELPVCHFVEWSDLWSMGDVFVRWLSPADAQPPIHLLGNRYEILACTLPDEGRLANHLASAGKQQFPEYEMYIARLQESLRACDALALQATLVVLRYVTGGTVQDHEVTESLTMQPKWLPSGRPEA